MSKMNLKVIKTPKEAKHKVELSVEAPQDISEKSYALALKRISQNIDIPGFRKGKAPKEVIEKQVGVGNISQRAFESVFYEILQNVSIQEELDIMEVNQIMSYELLPGKPLTFKVVVELKPEVKLGKYIDLKVKTKKIVYDKEKFIDKTIEKITNNFITFKKLTEGKVREGDLITVDFEGKFEDGTEVPGGKAENFQAILDKEKFLPEFVDKLIGINVGDTVEISVTFPENYATGFSGKKASFKVKINSVEQKILPKVDQEFAKKLGLKDMDEVKEKILAQMIELQNIASQREFENKIVEQVVKNSEYEITPPMLEREVNFLLKDIRVQCERDNISWDTFISDEKNNELIKKAREAAKNRISIDLVLSAIVRKENIKVADDELMKEVKNRVSQLGEKYSNLEKDISFRNTVELVILRNKAIDLLLSKNQPIWEEEVITSIP